MDKTVSGARGRRRLTRGGGSAAAGAPVSGPCANGIVVPQPAAHPELVRDCEALLSLRDTLTRPAGVGGAPFGGLLRPLRRRGAGGGLNWDVARPLAEWKGIGVAAGHASLRVVALSLVGMPLQGSLPPELGRLAHLQLLYLANNQLTGPVPPALGQLTHLEWLALADNQLTGSIPASLQNVPDHDLDQLGLSVCS